MCLRETKYQERVSHHSGGSTNFAEKVSRDMGYRSDSIAISRDMWKGFVSQATKKRATRAQLKLN